MQTTVWVFQPLPDFGDQTGYVLCDEELAAKLLAAGAVQDPWGEVPLKHITDKPAAAPKAEYDTKVMTPKPTRGK